VATAAVRDGQGLLLPPVVAAWVADIQPRLSRLGIQLVDGPRASVDPATSELVISAPTIEHDPSVIAELDDGVRLGSELPRVQPGRHPLRSWYLPSAEDRVGPLPHVQAVACAIPQLTGGVGDAQAALAQLVELTDRCETIGVWPDSPEHLAEQLA
jgi:hypothetical protein